MKNISILILLTLALLSQVNSENYTLNFISQANGAACLDGSPPGIYIHQGSGENKNNFIVYFQGGGFCGNIDLASTLQSCYQRSSTDLGTSKVLPASRSFDQNGILSTDPVMNSYFYDWTKVVVEYCDGAQYFGSRQQPIPYKDKQLFFRGTNNVNQTVRFLQQKYDIFRKNKIIVSGKSAGGIATYLYSDHFYTRAITAKVYSIPDSGLFLTDYQSPIVHAKVIRVVSKSLIDIVWGQGRYPIGQCLDQWKNDTVQCFNAKNLVKYRKVPMFIIQSPYDQWSIDNLLLAQCLTNSHVPYSLSKCNDTYLQAINDYKNQSRRSIKQMIENKSNMGAWAPSCVQHGFVNAPSMNSQGYKVPTTNGIKLQDAIYQFIQNPQRPPVYMDTVDWPYNTGCSGVSQMKNLRDTLQEKYQ